MRTLMIDLESRCGEDLSVDDDFFPRLVEHACDLLNTYKVRRGNLTAWEAIKGEPYMGEVYAFGTPVQHRISGPVQGGGLYPNDGSTESGWESSSRRVNTSSRHRTGASYAPERSTPDPRQ